MKNGESQWDVKRGLVWGWGGEYLSAKRDSESLELDYEYEGRSSTYTRQILSVYPHVYIHTFAYNFTKIYYLNFTFFAILPMH